jgi:hypothetical protein
MLSTNNSLDPIPVVSGLSSKTSKVAFMRRFSGIEIVVLFPAILLGAGFTGVVFYGSRK